MSPFYVVVVAAGHVFGFFTGATHLRESVERADLHAASNEPFVSLRGGTACAKRGGGRSAEGLLYDRDD